MGRIIAIAILAAGILAAACDNGTTGPTVYGGEVEFETLLHFRHGYLSRGQGYNFVKGQKIEISKNDTLEGRLGELSDIDLWSTYIYAKPKRIYLDNGERVYFLCLRVGESATFKLRTLKDNARCETTIKYVSQERFVEERFVKNKFLMRYKIEIYSY